MKPSWMRRSVVPMLLLPLLLWSCDSADTPTGAQAGPASGPAFSTSSTSYHLVKGNDGDSGLAAAVIGAEGGVLQIGEHELIVPADAVDEPTVFSMAIADSAHIRVNLAATRISADGQIVNVGEKGFLKPVHLTLSYSAATEPVKESELLILWARSDGTLEAQPTTVDTAAKRVKADLGHFSGYLIGGEDDPTAP